MSNNLISESREVSKIYETKNFDLFKFKEGNRNVSQKHIKKLTNEIIKEDLRIPIQVSPSGEILDGQHRFIAYKTLNRSFRFYIETDNTKVEDIQKMNTVNRSWSQEDILDSQVKLKNPHYVEFDRIAKKHNLKISVVLRLFNISRGKFMDGSLKMNDKNDINIMINNIETILKNWKDKPSDKLQLAIINFFRTYKEANLGDLVAKLIQYPSKTYDCTNELEYVDCLLNLYNIRNRKPIIKRH